MVCHLTEIKEEQVVFFTAVYLMNHLSTVEIIKWSTRQQTDKWVNTFINFKMFFSALNIILIRLFHLFIPTNYSVSGRWLPAEIPLLFNLYLLLQGHEMIAVTQLHSGSSGICFMALPWTVAKISFWVHSDCIQDVFTAGAEREDYGSKCKNLIPVWVAHGSQVTVSFLKAPLLGGLSFALTFRTE